MLYPTHERRDEEDLLEDAYDEGWDAAGEGDKDNPYRQGSELWQEWWSGYYARRDGRD